MEILNDEQGRPQVKIKGVQRENMISAFRIVGSML